MPKITLRGQLPVAVNCSKCDKNFEISYDTYRKRSIDYQWKCKQCMSIHMSNMHKTRIAKYSPDHFKEIKAKQRQGIINYYNNITDEERQRLSEIHKKNMLNLTDEEKKQRVEKFKQWYASLTEEEKDKRRQIGTKALELYKKSLTEEEYNANELKKITSYKKTYALLSEEEKFKRKLKLRKVHREYLDNMTEDQKQQRADMSSKRFKAYWKNLSQDKLSNISKRVSNHFTNYWANVTDEELKEKYEKQQNSARGKNKLHQKFELHFFDNSVSKEFTILPEIAMSVSMNGNMIRHIWDYCIIKNQTNDIVMFIDLDGDRYHGDNRFDYDGLFSKEKRDQERFLTIPKNIKVSIIYEFNFIKSFELMIQNLNIDYNEFIKTQFKLCRSMPIPLPCYTYYELHWSYISIIRLKHYDKYHQNLSLPTLIGNHIITHFHSSIYQAKCKDSKISPYDAWYDDNLMYNLISNHFIHINPLNYNKIMQGFNITTIAQRVSVFSAGRAKLLIHKYLNGYDEVFDPFSSFSGRMLGAVSLGKKYIGQDISPTHVMESNAIIDYFKLQELATVTVNNAITSKGNYQCLFTCPPYSDSEQWYGVPVDTRSCDDWIDICLANFKCNRYLFVVDATIKYQDKIVDTIVNRNHFGSNGEFILRIDR